MQEKKSQSRSAEPLTRGESAQLSSKVSRVMNNELGNHIGKEVTIWGWLHNFRELGGLAFLVLRDRTGFSQSTLLNKDKIKEIAKLQPGSVLQISGKVAKTEKTDAGVELVDIDVVVINSVTEPFPFEMNKQDLKVNLDTLLENRSVSLRHPKQAAIFKIQGVIAQAYRKFMIENGFTEYFGPAILASASEGGAELFKVDYFDKPAILAQSNQLYKQMLVGVYERVFAMAKCFRAENSNTRRHLTEVIQFEFELGFIRDITDVTEKLEAVIRYMLKEVAEKCKDELLLLGKDLVIVPKESFPMFKFSEAIEIISKETGEDTAGWDDLTTDSEKVLCNYVHEKFGSDFVFVTNYPKGKFYAYRDEKGVFHNFDLLCREAEIVSGGRRVDNYDQLVSRILEEGLNPDDFTEYLSIFKYGMPPHGGFGMGLERFTMLALGLENIREATLFPSDTKRIASQQVTSGVKAFGEAEIKKAIKMLFVESDLEFEVSKHEETPTSDDAAKVRNMPLASGVKALVLKEKSSGKNVLVNVPADQKLDIKKFSQFYSQKTGKNSKFEFEKPEVIKKLYGLNVGGVPPFGHVFGVETFIDSRVKQNKDVAFNNADKSESLICNAEDLLAVLDASQGDFC